jgi:hypothetical protein
MVIVGYSTIISWILTHAFRKRRMGNEIPRFVELLEDNKDISRIQPFTKPISLVCSYTTLDEKEALENGATVEEAKNYKMAGQLHPGTMFITNYVIGLRFKVPGNTIYPIVDVNIPL